jgi:hypothetical protein
MDSRVEIVIGRARLLVEGQESFVAATLNEWGPKIASAKAPSASDTDEVSNAPPSDSWQNHKQKGLSQYENVFDSADGKMKIIAHVPGGNKAVITRNTALIYLFGRLLEGVESVPSEEVRQACVDQGCYDPTNFAQYLKGLKSAVVMNTKPGGGYDVRLTAPGRKAARELVESLNGEAA